MKTKLIDIVGANSHPGLMAAVLKAKVRNLASELRSVEYEFRMAIRDSHEQEHINSIAGRRTELSQQISKTKRCLATINS